MIKNLEQNDAYKDIDIFVGSINKVEYSKKDINSHKIKFDLNDLNKLKVIGLKELCIKHKIITKKNPIRDDYISALLNY